MADPNPHETVYDDDVEESKSTPWPGFACADEAIAGLAEKLQGYVEGEV